MPMARRSMVLKISAGMVRQPQGGRFPFLNRIGTRRRGRWFRPIGSPIIILRSGLRGDFYNLVRAKSRVPNHLPFRCQTLQMDEAILAAGFCLPTIIADSYLRCLQFNDALWVGGQFLDLINALVLLTHLGESSFVTSRIPIPKKNDEQCANHHCHHARKQCRSLTMLCTNRFMHRRNKSNNEDYGQQLNEGIGVSRRTARLNESATIEHDLRQLWELLHQRQP